MTPSDIANKKNPMPILAALGFIRQKANMQNRRAAKLERVTSFHLDFLISPAEFLSSAPCDQAIGRDART